MIDVKEFLSVIEPFRRLPSHELDRIASVAQEVEYQKGTHIFSEGDPADSLYVLKAGRIEIFKFTTTGRPSAIESLRPGLFFGILCRLGADDKHYPCTAVASVPSKVVRIPDTLFLDLFKRYPAFVAGVCVICSEKLNMMQELTATSKEPVDIRIVKTLFKLSETHGDVLPYTKRQIAEFSATTVETCIRKLALFQKMNWIASSRGQIVVKDHTKLATLINQKP